MKKSKDYNRKDFNCSDRDEDRAVGDLLKIAQDFESIAVTVSVILTPFSYPGMVTSRFIRDGTRTNGYLKRAGSLSKLFKESTEYLLHLERVEKDVKDRRLKAQKMLNLLDDYCVCKECNGDCGELLGPNYFCDCEACDGQGMVTGIANATEDAE